MALCALSASGRQKDRPVMSERDLARAELADLREACRRAAETLTSCLDTWGPSRGVAWGRVVRALAELTDALPKAESEEL